MLSLEPTDVLLVIDMQVDFLPGGALAVPGGYEIVPGIHALARRFEHVVLTQDWHPAGHISFASAHGGKRPFMDITEASYGAQTLWPDHCVQGSAGAALAPALDIPHAELILRKGFRRSIDSYSAFEENDRRTPTGLAGYLGERGLKRLFLCGLAFDFCVGASAVDADRLGFEVLVVEDLTRAVDLPASAEGAGSVARTRGALAARGIRLIASSEVVEAGAR